MKLFRLLIILVMFICSKTGWSQVLGYPGATWVFYNPPFTGVCFESYQKWTYSTDTIISGIAAKKVDVDGVVLLPPPFPSNQYYSYSKYFHVSGDSVSIYKSSDSSWIDLFDFSLQIGDTTHSPLLHRAAFGSTCDTTILYDFPAIVTNSGTDTIGGEILQFYTIKYRVGQYPNDDFTDTVFAYQTYWERIVGSYWYPSDYYNCGMIEECGPPYFDCYRDNDMISDSTCVDLTWFDHLSIQSEGEGTLVKIFPNPVSNQLFIEESYINEGRYMIICLDGREISGWVQSPINVAPLETGVYLLVNESRTWTKKFIKN